MASRSVAELEAELAARRLEEQLGEAKAAVEAERQTRIDAVVAKMAATSDPVEIARLVDELAEASKPASVDPDLKMAVREARRVHRELSAGPVDEGGVTVTPDVITTTSTVEGV